jgi:hypothetical protein
VSIQLAFNFDAPQSWQEILLGTRVPTEAERHEIIRFALRSYRPEQYLQFARSSNCSMFFGDAWCELCQRVRRYTALQTEGDASCSEYDLRSGYDARFYLDTGLIGNQIAHCARRCFTFEQAMHDAGDGEASSYQKMREMIEMVNETITAFEEKM